MLKFRFTALAALATIVMALAGPAHAADSASSAERQQKLIGVLQSSAPPQDKAIACKQLAIYGNKDAVPALAPLLADEKLASWARIPLEAIPDPVAGDALRDALGKLQGRLLIGAINSLGVRRDAKSVDALVPRLKDADADVASAAAAALGRIGGPAAGTALEQSLASSPAAVRSAVAEGCVLIAEQLQAQGKSDEAVKLYDTVRKADVPKPRILEATRGAILARGTAGVPLLLDQLRSADKAFFGIGLRTARELPGREVTEALVAELGKAAADRQSLLILVLADRDNSGAIPAVAEAVRSGPKLVRIAAIRMLQRQGDASCVPALVDAAGEADAELSQAAAAVLAVLPGKAVDADLAARLPKAEGKLRHLLIELAEKRRIEAAAPALRKAADDSDEQVRCAALKALGPTASADDLPLLIGRALNLQKAAEAKAAIEALHAVCIRMPDREGCAAKLTAALSQAPATVKPRLVETLGAMQGPKALAAVGAAAKDPSPELQDVGSRLLGEWMSVDAAPVLLDLAQNAADPKYKIRALRGYLRIVRQLQLPAEQRVSMARQALAVCQRDDERKLVIEVLRRNPSAESLSLVLPHLKSAALKADAANAAVSIGEKLLPADPAAVAAAMPQVIAAGDGKATGRAKAILEEAAKKSGKK